MEVITVINQKGGVGKTNVAGNLGAELAARGRSVIAIDSDPQGTLTIWHADRGAFSGLAEVLGYGIPDDQAPPPIEPLLMEIPAFGVRLLAANIERLTTAQETLRNQPTRQFDIAEAIGRLETTPDYVIIDSPPNLGPLTTAALYASTNVIVPIDSSGEAVEGLGLLQKTIRRASRIRPIRVLAVVATSFKPNTNLHPDVVDAVGKATPDALSFVVRDTIEIQRAFFVRKPIRAHAPNNPAAADYAKMAEAIDDTLRGDSNAR